MMPGMIWFLIDINFAMKKASGVLQNMLHPSFRWHPRINVVFIWSVFFKNERLRDFSHCRCHIVCEKCYFNVEKSWGARKHGAPQFFLGCENWGCFNMRYSGRIKTTPIFYVVLAPQGCEIGVVLSLAH